MVTVLASSSVALPASAFQSEMSVLSQISALNSAVPYLGQSTATMTGSISAHYTSTPISLSGPSPTDNQVAESAPTATVPTSSGNYLTSTRTNGVATGTPVVFDTGEGGGWGNMASGTHIGVIVSIIFAVGLIVFFSFWFCCGGRALWSRRYGPRTDADGLPLYTVQNGRNTQAGVNRADNGGDAPPVYAEVAPPQHQSVARGTDLRSADEVQREEAEEAVVSDGKTPLSEIPFEDVVLERHPSESESSSSASRDFEQRHHGMGGDTTGHTNT